MTSTRSLLILCTVIGTSVGFSPKAARNLNNKINLLKTTFERKLSSHQTTFERKLSSQLTTFERKLSSQQKAFKRKLSSQETTFQHEVDELKFRVMDLEMELHIENARASRLEAILNGTDFDEEAAANAAKTTKRERQGPSVSPTDPGIIQQHSLDIEQFRDSIERHEVAIADNKKAVQAMQQISVYERLYNAFQDEKKHKHIVLKELKTESEKGTQVIQTFTVDIADIRQRANSMSRQVENNTDTIAELGSDMTDQEQVFKEALDDALTMIRYRARNITVLETRVDNIVSDTLTTTTTTTLPQTSTSALEKLHEKCRQDIRAGGKAMAKRLYVGAIVKRGKDWKWDNEDDKGHGRILHLPHNLTTGWVHVRWYNTSVYGRKYRAYDLAIVEEKFDFSQCK